MPYFKKCCICNLEFQITRGTLTQTKTCSYKCHYELSKQITKKYAKLAKSTPKEKVCKNCNKIFIGNKLFNRVYCSQECQRLFISKERTGKGNPNFKTGMTGKDGFYRKGTKLSTKHLAACSKYKKDFLKRNSHAFCEVCNQNINGAKRFEVHHLYYASRFPYHKELHNFKNLIHICRSCHGKFHSGEYKDKFKQLEKERGLKKLFK